ncbi:hypothetical protein [Ferruginibacter albus]|uniref:hypothetical protein n=1 Tax=Ferruginibacter albus TaxID=2875540 RepID=UPI001CC7C805|nr:hypothetical protein [Ferruginibacter albus]UAY52896.1 hypothetical protein K9M53_04255 [Ferruginibacter albus]
MVVLQRNSCLFIVLFATGAPKINTHWHNYSGTGSMNDKQIFITIIVIIAAVALLILLIIKNKKDRKKLFPPTSLEDAVKEQIIEDEMKRDVI